SRWDWRSISGCCSPCWATCIGNGKRDGPRRAGRARRAPTKGERREGVAAGLAVDRDDSRVSVDVLAAHRRVVPLSAHVLELRDRGASQARRAEGVVARRPAVVAVPPLGRVGGGSGAVRATELKDPPRVRGGSG